MRYSLTLLDPHGEPLAGREVELLSLEDGRPLQLAVSASDDAGDVAFDAPLPPLPLLGLRVSGLPAIVAAQFASADVIELGAVVISEDEPLLESTVFPCEDGVCHGLPSDLYDDLVQARAEVSPPPPREEESASLTAVERETETATLTAVTRETTRPVYTLTEATSAETAREAEAELESAREELHAAYAETEQARAALVDSQAELKHTLVALASTKGALETTRAALSEQEAKAEQLSAELSEQQAKVEQLSTALADAEAALKKSTREATTAATTTNSQSLLSVLKSTVEEVDGASKSLEESQSRYSIGEVSVTLKGVLDGDGGLNVAFIDGESLDRVDAKHLGEVSFAVSPSQAPPPETTPTKNADDLPPAPDLRGYTRELAQRKLTAAGLLSSVSHISVDPRGAGRRDVGRVLRQQPAPGTPIAPGSHVRLFIGKADRSL